MNVAMAPITTNGKPGRQASAASTTGAHMGDLFVRCRRCSAGGGHQEIADECGERTEGVIRRVRKRDHLLVGDKRDDARDDGKRRGDPRKPSDAKGHCDRGDRAHDAEHRPVQPAEECAGYPRDTRGIADGATDRAELGVTDGVVPSQQHLSGNDRHDPDRQARSPWPAEVRRNDGR